jgi:hypothetical protein
VTTVFLGAKKEGLAIVNFFNKLIRVNNHCPAFVGGDLQLVAE